MKATSHAMVFIHKVEYYFFLIKIFLLRNKQYLTTKATPHRLRILNTNNSVFKIKFE